MIGKGIIAGFVATVLLSAMMLMKHSMGLMREMREPVKRHIRPRVTVRLAGVRR